MTHLLTALRDVVEKRKAAGERANIFGGYMDEEDEEFREAAAKLNHAALLTMLEDAQMVIELYAENIERDPVYGGLIVFTEAISQDAGTKARDYLAKYGEQK